MSQQIADDLNLSIDIVESILQKEKHYHQYQSFNISSTINTLFLYAINFYIFFAPFCFIKGLNDFSKLPQSLFIQIGSLFIFGLWIVKKIVHAQSVIHVRLSTFFRPILLLIVWASLTLIWAINPYEGIIIVSRWIASFLLLIIVSDSSKEDCQVMLKTLFCSGCCVALLGICQQLFGIEWIPQVRPPAATFAHKNLAVHFIMMTFPLGIAFFILSNTKKQVWLYSLTITVFFLYLYFTFTRAGWVVLFVQLVVLSTFIIWDIAKNRIYPSWYSGKSVPLLVGLIICLFMINIESASSSKTIKDAFRHFHGAANTLVDEIVDVQDASSEKTQVAQNIAKDDSFTGRLKVWKNSIAMIKDYPLLGVGAGNFKIVFPLYHRKIVRTHWYNEVFRVNNTHNDLIQFWVEYGSIGIILILYLFYTIATACLTIISNKQDTHGRYILLGIGLGLIGVLVNSCFSFPFQVSIPPFVFILYLGLISGLYQHDLQSKTISTTNRIALCLAFTSIMGCIMMCNIAYHWVKSEKHFLQSYIAERLNNWPMMIHEIQQAIQHNPYNGNFLSYLGRAYIEQGSPEKAISVFEKMLIHYPYHVNVLSNLAIANEKSGFFDQADVYYNKALSIFPDHIAVNKHFVNFYINQKKYNQRLVQALKIITDHEPNNEKSRYLLGVTYANLNDLNNAKIQLETLAVRKTNNCEVYILLSEVYFKLNQLENSKQALQQAKSLPMANESIVFNIGLMALKLGEYQDTITYFNQHIDSNPSGIDTLFNIAKLFGDLKDYERASIVYKIILSKQPGNASAHNNMGNIYKKMNQLESAYNEFLKASLLGPNIALFHYNLGIMGLKIGKYKESEMAFIKATQLDPSWAMAHKDFGYLLCQKLNRCKEALPYLIKALQLDPNIEDKAIINQIITQLSKQS